MLVNVVIPVYNEEQQLRSSVIRLAEFLDGACRFDWEIVIANNASTDQTLEIAHALSREMPKVRALHLAEKGRGRALMAAWKASEADILSYMDVDLSTDLSAFPLMIEALAGGGFDLGTGSRLLKPELTTRSFKREFISRCYNLLIRLMFRTRFSDAQCGFKAITKAAARDLLPAIEDTGWFFDSELLILAERLGYRLFDLPVRWIDDPDSRVKIVRTAIDDIRGLIRVKRSFWAGKYELTPGRIRSFSPALSSPPNP